MSQNINNMIYNNIIILTIHGFLSQWEDASTWVAGGGVDIKTWRLGANIFNKQSWTAGQEWSSSLGFGITLTTSHSKNVQKLHTD